MNSVEFSSKQIKRLLGLRGNKCKTSPHVGRFLKKKRLEDMTIKRQVCYIKCSKPKLKKTPMFRGIITRRIQTQYDS